MTRSIPGVLDYALLAQQHKPTDPDDLRAEVRRLAGTGLTPVDIATALRMDIAMVRELLAATTAEAADICARSWQR